MSRRVRRRFVKKGKEKVDCPEIDENLSLDDKGVLDWTRLPDDTVIQLFSCLNYRDRASLSSTCRTWRALGKSPCLWQVLDLRPHKCDATAAASLASRCENLQKLRFRGPESADAIINLQAKNLREIIGDGCRKMTDATLSVLAARHEALECLKLRLSGVHEVDAGAINALAKNCRDLTDIGFIDCRKLDETALGNVASVRFLSVAGTTFINWNLVLQQWSNLPNLIALDVSRTDITPSTVSRNSYPTRRSPKTNENCFQDWRNSKVEDRKTDEILNWLEWIISSSLLRVSESNPPGLDNFWLNQGTSLLLGFMQSPQEEVQERAATALATFVVIDDENASIDTGRAEAVMRDGGIRHLLNLARSWREGLQSEAAKAIANLSVNANVAKAVAEEGGITILVNLARSVNRLVAEEAAGGLWNLSVGEDHKGAIAEAGGVKALVDLIFKWSRSSGGEGVLERAAGALANLAADDKCSTEVASDGGVHALVKLARSCKIEGVQEQVAARALANLAAHGDSNNNNAAVGQEVGAVEALLQLTRSSHDGVRQEAAGALWNLSFDDRNREAIATSGGVEALLAEGLSLMLTGLQEYLLSAKGKHFIKHGLMIKWCVAVTLGQYTIFMDIFLDVLDCVTVFISSSINGKDSANYEEITPFHNCKTIASDEAIDDQLNWMHESTDTMYGETFFIVSYGQVALAHSCTNAAHSLQERAAGALWGLSVSEANSIAIGREGGVAPLIALARSDAEDVHETAAGALWNLAFNPGNALRIVEEGGVPALVHLCSSSVSKMARFMAALALAYMFDGRMDEIALVGTSTEGTSKSVNLDGLRKMALKNIEAFVMKFTEPQAFLAAAASSAPASLTQVTESARIQEAGHLRCRFSLSLSRGPWKYYLNYGAEIGRFVTMLRNPSPTLKGCAAFALLQFTIPGGRHAVLHVRLLQNAGATRVLRAAAAAAGAPIEAKIFARVVLRNLEQHPAESSV
ncbi:hypothetical protein DH2020_002467 [Rehmannia glutinosa]|uniref:F-box domain-containing protein n=1 Tax=Rehmannia glutinosa TaxID=99300 RepID=A0ABR0XU05_REHGL